MPTDDERREVAARLREHRDVRLFTGEDVERLIGIELSGFRPKDADNSYNRLADLIEPSCDRDTPQKVAEEMFGKMRHSTKEEADAYDDMLKSKSIEIHPVDRDALLALADEMDVDAGCHAYVNDNDAYDYARRIREALGVVE